MKPIEKRQIEAVINVLRASIDQGLNASLTPQDCAILLFVIRSKEKQTNLSPAMRKIMTVVSDFADGILDDLSSMDGGDGE